MANLKKILIVEDEALVAAMYKRGLASSKWEIEIAIDGEEGLQMARKLKPDLVLLDVMMPKMNGMQVLEELKKDEELREIQVIILSNLSGEFDKKLALSKGALDFWVKQDVQMKMVRERIAKILKLE